MSRNLNDTIKNNELKRQKYIEAINNYKEIYRLISRYYNQDLTYEDIISNTDSRFSFLVNSVNTAIKSDIMDDNTKELILNMTQEIFNYFLYGIDYEQIEIPTSIKDNIFNPAHLVDDAEIMFAFELIKANKKIFDAEFKKKNFSQAINEGFHAGIIESLKIEEHNLSHLLGLTNFGSLYEFYRKSFINDSIMHMVGSFNTYNNLERNLVIEKFQEDFKKQYGVDYSEKNYKKLINWRFDPGNKEESDQSITEEERDILNNTCETIGKSKTLDFYINSRSMKLLIHENRKVNTFVFDYIKKHILKIKNNKKDLNELKKIYNQEELKIVLDDLSKTDSSLLMRYVNECNYRFYEEKEFKESFLNTFFYEFPLINYDELLMKSIYFYNFSLFHNLNSIIVDYDAYNKKINSSVFLVSYPLKEREKNAIKTTKLINKKDKSYADAAFNENTNDIGLNHDYIDALKSLLAFPARDFYYFKYGFTSETKRTMDDKIIKEAASKKDFFSLIGFIDSEEEKERLKELEKAGIHSFIHEMRCETNINSDYFKYITDFTRSGIEYPVELIIEGEGEEGLDDFNMPTILRITPPQDILNYYIIQFIEMKHKYDFNEARDYEKIIIDRITKSLDQITKLEESSYLIEIYQNKDNYKRKDNTHKKILELKELKDNLTNYFDEYKSYLENDDNIKIVEDNNDISIENDENNKPKNKR